MCKILHKNPYSTWKYRSAIDYHPSLATSNRAQQYINQMPCDKQQLVRLVSLKILCKIICHKEKGLSVNKKKLQNPCDKLTHKIILHHYRKSSFSNNMTHHYRKAGLIKAVCKTKACAASLYGWIIIQKENLHPIIVIKLGSVIKQPIHLDKAYVICKLIC